MPRILAAALGALALCLAVPTRAAAQNTCELVYQNGPWTSVGDPAQRVISADGPLLVRCAAGEELRSDSAVIYQTINEVHLFGQVDYQDPGRALTSDRATYNSATGRLYATGNVVFTDKNRGSTLRGPELEYFRAAPGRDAQAIATGRPHLTVTPKPGSGGQRRDPMEVDADRITSVGERFMTAEGNAVIVSKDTRSTADEAYYDADQERVELRRNARVDSEKYDLTGNFIESKLENGAIRQVLARTDARLESERMTATGPQLQLFFDRDLLQRTIASREPGKGDSTAASRSVALAKGFRLEADSIEAISPDQQLRQVNAVGKAQGVSWDTIPPAPRVVAADSGRAAGDSGRAVPIVPVSNTGSATTPPEGLAEKDVLTADTIVAFFRTDSASAARADSAGPRVLGTPTGTSTPAPATPARPDTAARDTADTEIERLLATGDARSLYRMRDDSAKAGQTKPGLNYLIGDQIDLRFVDGEVDVAHVRGLKKGVYLDPAQPGAARDSTAAATGNRPGTAGATNGGAARPAGRAPASPARPATGAPPAAPTNRPPATRTVPTPGRQP